MGESPLRSGARSTLSAEDVRAAAEVHGELGPDYSDAVVESFLSRIDEHIEARVEQRVGRVKTRRRKPADPARLSKQRTAAAGFAAGSLVVGVPLTVSALAYYQFPSAPTHVGALAVLWIWLVIAAACGVAAYRRRRR
jgi:hypothetical protein